MSERPNSVSITERVRTVATGGPVIAIHFLVDRAAFVLAEEAALLMPSDGSLPQRIALHDGGILASASDGTRVVTGGDDGKVVQIDAAGTTRTVFADPKQI